MHSQNGQGLYLLISAGNPRQWLISAQPPLIYSSIAVQGRSSPRSSKISMQFPVSGSLSRPVRGRMPANIALQDQAIASSIGAVVQSPRQPHLQRSLVLRVASKHLLLVVSLISQKPMRLSALPAICEMYLTPSRYKLTGTGFGRPEEIAAATTGLLSYDTGHLLLRASATMPGLWRISRASASCGGRSGNCCTSRLPVPRGAHRKADPIQRADTW